MGTLLVLSITNAVAETPKATALQRLRRMNAFFYAALKIDELTWEEKQAFTKCLEYLPMPPRVTDAEVIAALADPDRNYVVDFQATPFRYRRPMHVLLSGLFGIRTDAFEREETVKRRLGLVRRVILPIPMPERF